MRVIFSLLTPSPTAYAEVLYPLNLERVAPKVRRVQSRLVGTPGVKEPVLSLPKEGVPLSPLFFSPSPAGEGDQGGEVKDS